MESPQRQQKSLPFPGGFAGSGTFPASPLGRGRARWKNLSVASAPLSELRLPASASLRLRLAGRGPNSFSLHLPLAAVVAVALVGEARRPMRVLDFCGRSAYNEITKEDRVPNFWTHEQTESPLGTANTEGASCLPGVSVCRA